MTTKTAKTAEPLTTEARLADARQRAQARLTAAQTAEQEAKATLTSLRERHKADGDVTAEEFGAAAHAVELAELDRVGAEDALAEAGRRERLEVLAGIRAEIEAGARPERAAEAFKRFSNALADLTAEIGPQRTRTVADWIHRIRNNDVPPVRGNELPAKEDAGLAWSDTGWGGRPGCVIWLADDGAKRAAHTHYDLQRILAAGVYRACRKAGVSGHEFGVSVSTSDNSLIDDPDAWFLRNG